LRRRRTSGTPGPSTAWPGPRAPSSIRDSTGAWVDDVFDKGRDTAAYSGFEARSGTGKLLGDRLREAGVEELEVAGIATDYCVRATVLDALREGFKVTLRPDLCAGVAPETSDAALAEMLSAGASVA